ncbi:NAD(P)-dependent oxidoreductase [Taibaiella lutea]|uniref:NAD(P)-dependent oxidoreductase n=1 Tax=Taibaiella lutea TaxID=2608001 RepID=A0A5M6CND6_9BACT|nr:NAD(P)-dependent oxidoreductase [Taibaiella lutea]KAA5534659.1 NAD(P)-dependent oxidoreductase [Taibaiella lutea]
MGLFENRTFFITGASRGIGKAIALKLAGEGANIVIAAKSTEENPKLGGTIFSAAKEVEDAGGKALAVQCDIRNEENIQEAVAKAVAHFGGIDAVINNASAISLTNTETTESKRFDLMHDINVRGTFLVTKHCIPHLLKSGNAHILTLSPPIDLNPKWLGAHIAYTMSKYNMTMMAMGWAEEFKGRNIASNSLWPVTTIATAAVNNLLGGDYLIQRSRTTDIIADAVFYIMQQASGTLTGRQLLDEEILKEAGITDFTHYAVNTANGLQKDLFL